jgi:Tfp pilus assembly protein PilZ
LEGSEERLVRERRKHYRKSFFMVVDYATQERTYKDFIKNISTGGVFIETRMPMDTGQKVAMSFPLPNSQQHIKIAGEIVRSSLQGIGVKFILMEGMGKGLDSRYLQTAHQNFLAKTKEENKMARVRKRKVRWNGSNASGVVCYRLYWAVGKEVNYDSDFAEVGNVTEVILPDDVPSFPIVAGDMELGVVAIDHIGNESDMTKLSASFDFTAPDAPTGLAVETI